MRKIIGLIAAFLLLASSAGATLVIDIYFGSGIQHNTSEISAIVGAPVLGQEYYFTETGASINSVDAFVVSTVTMDGEIDAVYTETGDCTWRAKIENGDYVIVTVESFDTTTVSEGNDIKWSAEPDNESVTHCKLEIDYEVI